MRHNAAMRTREWLRQQGEFDKDRAPPECFAGRADELATIIRRAARNVPGNTMVLQGAPGAGKTTLLREAASRFAASGSAALFYDGPWSRDEESGVLRDLARAALGVDAGHFATAATSARSAKDSILGLGGSVTRKTDTPPTELAHWTDFIRHFTGEAADARPVLILVDESQNFEPDAGRLVRALHAQAEFPFTLVCGGLTDTRDKLREIGISRLGADATLRIGALAMDEARESIRGTLSRMIEVCKDPPIGGSVENLDRWTAELASASFGWPQHVASILAGACRALADGERLDLGDERNLTQTLAYGRRLCAAYYEGRIDASRTEASIILAAHRALQGGRGSEQSAESPHARDAFDAVYDAIEQAVENLPKARRARHGDAHPDGTLGCYKAMLKAGVIEERDGERLAVPIPSLTAHLERVVAGRGSVEP